jgi:Na+/citrate or Na+/malate symporter
MLDISFIGLNIFAIIVITVLYYFGIKDPDLEIEGKNSENENKNNLNKILNEKLNLYES